MKCQACNSQRVALVCGKTSDLCVVEIAYVPRESDGYVPRDMNIGGGDYLEFNYCLDCGQIQGEWPLPIVGMEERDE